MKRLDRDAYLARMRALEAEASARPTGTQDKADCCCHGFDEPCGHGFGDRHIHKCLPRALDLGGHCPDDGCAGRCWEDA